MAYQPRVIKQNRGSAGEGIWIIKLKKGNYCKNFGDRICEDNEVLSLMEANDNHSEDSPHCWQLLCEKFNFRVMHVLL